MVRESNRVFAEPDRRSLVDQLVDTIAQTLLNGQFEPGKVLPPERELALSLGVNRTSLRQALARLEQVGLVRSHHGVGTVVCDPTESTDAAVLALLVGRHGSDLVADALDVRQVLSPLVARLAARRAAPDDVARIEQALAEVALSTSPASAQRAEAVFFDAVIDATSSVALRFLWNALNAVYRSTLALFEGAYGDLDTLHESLAAIADGIRAADAPRAEDAISRYCADNARRMLAAFRAQEARSSALSARP